MKLYDRQSLPTKLYTAEQVRQLDSIAINEYDIPGFDLMSRAGHGLFRALLKEWPQVKSLSVFCGGGNNGGDGYIVAGLAKQKGIKVQLIVLSPPDELTGDALKAWHWAKEKGVEPVPWQNALVIAGEVCVDAMLGTGLTGSVRGDYAAAIALVNESMLPVVAADIPSGLCSDTGSVLGVAVDAALTVTFIGVKKGLLTGQGPSHCGELLFDNLTVPELVYEQVPAAAERIDLKQMSHLVPSRSGSDHKGVHGRVLLIGGNHGMGGAIILAAEAALKSGVGLVSVITRPEHVGPLLTRSPEVMVTTSVLADGTVDSEKVSLLIRLADAVVIGPGLGKDDWAKTMLAQVWRETSAVNQPLLCDADALNIIAECDLKAPHGRLVMTPHPGEAARLLSKTVPDVEADRFQTISELVDRFSAVALLKGAGTLVSEPCVASESGLSSPPWVATVGNPGMATGGMGDVLSGIIGGLLAQNLPCNEAVGLGVCWHGEAADRVACSKGMISLSATDVIDAMAETIAEYE